MRDDIHDAAGINSHSQCDGLRRSALWSCQRTRRPGIRSTRERMRTATTDTTTRRAVAAAVSEAGRHTAAPAGGAAQRGTKPREPSTSRLDRASTQPAGERSFIANPLPLKTNDDPPAPSLERPTGDAPLRNVASLADRTRQTDRHAITRVPVRLPRQHPVNQHRQQPITTSPDPAGRTDTRQPALDPSGTNPRPQ